MCTVSKNKLLRRELEIRKRRKSIRAKDRRGLFWALCKVVRLEWIRSRSELRNFWYFWEVHDLFLVLCCGCSPSSLSRFRSQFILLGPTSARAGADNYWSAALTCNFRFRIGKSREKNQVLVNIAKIKTTAERFREDRIVPRAYNHDYTYATYCAISGQLLKKEI